MIEEARANRMIQAAAVVAAAALLWAALWFRSAGLFAEPLWLDEAYSAYAAGKGFAFLWQVVPLYETHPPFYYSLLRVWTLIVGDSLAGVRTLGLACGLATLPVLLLAAREAAALLGIDRARLHWLLGATLALASLSFSLIQMTREVRPYPVMILVMSGAIWALFRVARQICDGEGIARPAYAIYLASLALMLWLHNLGPLYGLAIGLALAVLVVRPGLSGRDWLWLFGGHALVAIAYLPALGIMLDQAPTWIRSTWLTFDPALLRPRLASLYAVHGNAGEAAALLLVALAIAALARIGGGWRVVAALALLAFLPVVLSILLSIWVAPVFIVRTMTATVPPFLLLAALATAQGGVPRWLACAALSFLLWQLASLDDAARRSGPRQDWYAATRWLSARFQPGDIVYAYPNEGALPFDRAVRDIGATMPSRAIPTAIPSLNVGGWHPTGSRGVVSLPRDRLRAIAQARETRAVPTVWLLRLGPWAYDKGDIFLEELGRGRTRVGVYRDGPIDIVGLRAISPGPAGRAGAAAAR